MADEIFAKEFDKNFGAKFFRFHTQHDIVPTLPSPIFPHGKEYKQFGESILLKSPEFVRAERLRQRLFLVPFVFEGARSHFPSEYKEALRRTT